MWPSLLLAGILGGWWGVFALSPAPPAGLSVIGTSTSRRSTSSISLADDYYYGKTMIFGLKPAPREESLRYRDEAYRDGGRGVDKNLWDPRQLEITNLEPRQMEVRRRHARQPEILPLAKENIGKAILRDDEKHESGRRGDVNLPASGDTNQEARDPISVSREPEKPAAVNYGGADNFAPTDRHYANDTTTLGAIGDPRRVALAPKHDVSAAERARVTRSLKQQQRPRNRTRTDSPREQRRRCRNRNCRGRNWCPDMDVGNRGFLAPTVFEGKARSMSSLRKPGSNYAVTFEVKQVYKSQPGFLPLQKNDSVRLHFRDKTVPGKSTICGHDGKETAPADGAQRSRQQKERDNVSGGVVRANIKRGKVYLVFVNRVGPRNFTILGEPVIRNKKNEQAVQAVIRPDYVREVTLSELRDSVARYRDRVKLVCRTRGSPPPRVHWLKDGVPLQPRRGLRIQHKRRRSKVVISSARPEDSGRYECVAESTSGHRASLAAQLLVAHDTRIPETTTAAWLRQEQPCPIAGDFCMNGGTCLFFETVGEPACRCAEGFTGLRCETKDVISTGSVYNRHRAPFSCKLGLSTSYYC